MGKDILYPLRRLHGILHDELARHRDMCTYRKQLSAIFQQNPRTVFLILTPQHDNLGDHAIASAEIQLLQQADIRYIEITGKQLDTLQQRNLLGMMNGYPILLQGGGYLGTLWFGAEKMLREIIVQNPKSQIISLPNTIFYEDSAEGQKEFQNSIDLYRRHQDLHLYAREKASYSVMSKAYRNVKLIPDMVLSMNKCGTPQERHGCLLCLRRDREKTRTDEQERVLRQQAAALFGDCVTDTDMVADGPILPEHREEALSRQFSAFSSAELVVTDRLHGMIFCAITGTPCVVINSKSPKVRGCYEWIKHLDYIRFANDAADLSAEYAKIPKGVHTYDNTQLQHYYQELMDDISTILHWR